MNDCICGHPAISHSVAPSETDLRRRNCHWPNCRCTAHTLAPAGGCEPATPPRDRTTTPAGATNDKDER